MYNTNIKQTIGKIEFTMDKNNLRLRAKIGSNLTFIGGTNNNGYFADSDSAKVFIKTNTEVFQSIKNMDQLIYAKLK